MSLSFEKLLSAAANVTGRVAKILRAPHILGYIFVSFLSCRKVNRSMLVINFDGRGGEFYISIASSVPSVSAWLSWVKAVLKV